MNNLASLQWYINSYNNFTSFQLQLIQLSYLLLNVYNNYVKKVLRYNEIIKKFVKNFIKKQVNAVKL